jgi:putative pyoverdin transport system ATP-binding/permease protein
VPRIFRSATFDEYKGKFSMLVFLWRSSWRVILLVVALGIASGLGSAALIALINSTLAHKLGQVELLWDFSSLSAIVLLSGSLSHYLITRLSERTVCELRIKISRLMLAAPYTNLQKLGKHRLLANLTEDIKTISGACELLPVLCIHTAVIIGCIAYLAWLSWQLALILTAIILFGVLTYQLMNGLPKKAITQAREEYDNLNKSFRALTEGIKELKLHRQRSNDFMNNSLAISADGYRRYSLKGTTLYLLANQWVSLLYYLTIGLIICVLPLLPAVNQEIVSGYTLVFLFMMSPLSIVTTSLPTFARAKIALDKVQKLGHLLSNIQPNTTLVQPDNWQQFQHLSLHHVTHSFHREKENRNFTLGPINLEFNAGELVFLIGGNGSGKTTLAMLLLGLYIPEQGELRLNNVLITDTNRDAYLQNFSVVFSDFYLFDELFGFDSDQVNAKVLDYLDRLHLQHKVKIDNGRFSTLDLSLGQRKRLALLIAYLEDRPFYVFDEWAADQDPEFKDLFYTELLPALTAKGKTVLAITHDDRYFHLADRCIKLDEGQITSIDYPSQPSC